MSLALGIGVGDITPPPGLPMGGYAARAAPAEATLDPLTCRAAVFRGGGQTAALIVLDLLYVRDPWAAAVRRRIAQRLDTEPAAVMIAATHTHAGPAVFGAAMSESAELADYEQQLAGVVDSTIEDAAVTPHVGVTLRYGTAVTDGVAANRQEKERRFDSSVRVLVARDGHGRPVGAIASFGCHPTVLSAANLSYSRDLFGAAVDLVEKEIQAPVLLFNGAAADVSTRFTRRAQTPDEVERLGRQLAAGIGAAVRAARPVDDEPIAAQSIAIDLEPRRLPPVEAAQARLAAMVSRREHARGDVADADLRRLTADIEGAAAQLYFAQQGVDALLGRLPERALLQTLRIGGCDILGIPGEVFSEVGRQICSRRPRPALLTGYANDYIGYLVPPGSSEGYESLMSFVSGASAAAIADAFADGGEDEA